MLEALLLGAICVALLASAICGIPVIYALTAGLCALLTYALVKTRDARKVFRTAASGVKTVSAVIIMLVLIGMLGATWRASGTVPYLIYHALGLCDPNFALIASFLICGGMSVLMGTAIGAASAVGIVCMAICLEVGVAPAIAGGAILAGCAFGDRWSYLSTSAMIVAETTGTDRYENLSRMVKPTILPLAITLAIFLVLGTTAEGTFSVDASQRALHQGFTFTPWLLVPVAAIIGLSLLRIKFQTSLIVGTLSAVVLMFAIQGFPPEDLPSLLVFGFHPAHGFSSQVAGGGIISMAYVIGIVAVSSCYMGLLSETGMIQPIRDAFAKLSSKSTRFISVMVSSVASNMLACNMTMAIMLVSQFHKDDGGSPEELALIEGDTVVPIAALIPWNNAALAPLQIVGAPAASVAFAFSLYLLPLLGAIKSLIKRKQGNATDAD